MLSFILSLLWLSAGILVLAYQALTGDERLTMHFAGLSLSSGWLMIVMSGYNFVRWWTRRPSGLPARESAFSSRRQRIRRIEEPTERDPNFTFTDAPPPRHDGSPSQN